MRILIPEQLIPEHIIEDCKKYVKLFNERSGKRCTYFRGIQEGELAGYIKGIAAIDKALAYVVKDYMKDLAEQD